MNLSVVLATFNEEKNIKDCLDSVKNIADEIIVVDGTSQDKTREIAKSLGAKVFKVPNNPMFHKNKQIAIDKAEGNWILQLDADEKVSKKLAIEIQDILDQEHNAFNGYFIPRKNWFLGRYLKKSGAYPDYVIRLFKHGKGNLPRKSVHEQIKINGKIGYLKNDLLHNADPDIDKYFLRMNRYTQLEADKLVKNGFKPNLFNLLNYVFFKPMYWFIARYIRHKGFLDGYQGFLFALLSALHYPLIWAKAASKIYVKKH
jgi:glycosyltransferase involved in cell wall biosynthesis